MAKSYFEQMKEAIEKQDWAKMAKAYEAMTGEKVELSKPHAVYDSEDSEEEDDGGVTQTGARLSNNSMGASNRKDKKSPVRVARVNLFVDDGTEFVNEKQTSKEKAIAKKTTKGRPKAETLKIKCKKCKNESFIEKSSLPVSYQDGHIVYKDFICGECVAKKGR